MLVKGGATNVTTYFVLRLAATGVAATGITITEIDLQYVRSGVAPTAKVDATALGATDTAHTDNYAKEIDATDQPGLYRVDWPDAAFAAGVREVILSVKWATAFTEHLRVEIDGEVNVVEWAGTDVVAGAIPAAAADAAGGLAISDAGGLDLDAILVDTGTTLQAELDAIQAAVITNAAGSDIAADIIAIKAETATIVSDTNELQSDDLPGKIVTLDAVVDTVKVDTAAILVDTNEMQSDNVPGLIAALNNISTAQVNTEVDTALADIHLDHLLAADYNPSSKPGSATALLNEIVENDGGVSRFTANALEQAPSAGVTVAAIADAVWDEAQSGHTSADTFGALATEIAVIDGIVDTILLDTAELQTDDTPAAIAALNDPTVAEIADAVWDELRAGHTTNGTFGQNTQADIIKCNGTSVTGDGETGTEWGPA